jgi:DNA replicative helicase MCM subunit Mcm2 (Cdc46/Mcm family)
LQTLTKNSPAIATGAHVSIIGHITREELLRYLNDIEQANGFGNRFLWFCVKRSKMLPHGSKIDAVDFSEIIEKLKKAINFASAVDEIKWSKETEVIWEKVYPSLSEGKPGLFGGITARSEAYVVRLSCIYALLDLTNVIRPQHIAAALAIWDYVEASVKYIFQNRTGDPVANKIYSALKESEDNSMTRTEIRDLFGRNLKSDRINAALEILEANKLAIMETISTEGRSQEVWRIERHDDS